jgi:hypothetical protein
MLTEILIESTPAERKALKHAYFNSKTIIFLSHQVIDYISTKKNKAYKVNLDDAIRKRLSDRSAEFHLQLLNVNQK